MVQVPVEVSDAVANAQNIVAVMHTGADGDCLGAIIALQRSLSAMGKKIYIPAPLNIPPRYELLKKYYYGFGSQPQDYDLVLAVDCSSPDRIDWGAFTRDDSKTFICIDHHDGNPNFAHINWVVPECAAAGAMIFALLKKIDAPIDAASASALYISLLTDTGRFSFNNTNAEVLRTASELVELGADPKFITSEIYFNFEEDYLRNMGIAFFNSRSFHGGRVLFLTIDRAMTRNFATHPENSEGIIDFALSVKDVDVAVLFKEIEANLIRVSLRSRMGLDISAIANKFGGGGHPNAAGCTILANLTAAQREVLRWTEKLLGYN